MKNRRKQEKIAKILLKKSLTEDGTIDAKKIKLILSEVIRQTPPQFINILKIYKKLVTNSLASEELTVETAQKLLNQEPKELTTKLIQILYLGPKLPMEIGSLTKLCKQSLQS